MLFKRQSVRGRPSTGKVFNPNTGKFEVHQTRKGPGESRMSRGSENNTKEPKKQSSKPGHVQKPGSANSGSRRQNPDGRVLYDPNKGRRTNPSHPKKPTGASDNGFKEFADEYVRAGQLRVPGAKHKPLSTADRKTHQLIGKLSQSRPPRVPALNVHHYPPLPGHDGQKKNPDGKPPHSLDEGEGPYKPGKSAVEQHFPKLGE